MAARLNTKLVAVLIICLGFVGGGAVTLSYLMRSNPERNRLQGDALAAKGNWREAEEAYSKAVNKDQANVGYIDLWIKALQNAVPRDETEAREDFLLVTSLLQKKSTLQPENALYLSDYLEHLHRVARTSGAPSEFSMVYTQADEAFRRQKAGSDAAAIAQRYRGIAGASQAATGELNESARWQVKEDLTAALTRQPGDVDAATALAGWYLAHARFLRSQNQTAQADEVLDEGLEFAREFAARNSKSLQAAFSLAATLRGAALLRPDKAEPLDQEYRSQLEEARRRVSEDSSAPDQIILNLAGEIAQGGGPGAVEEALALAATVESRRPGTPAVLLVKADLLARSRRFDDAISALQVIGDLPNLPTGIDSVMLFNLRREALIAEFEIQVDRWVEAGTQAPQSLPIAARARDLRSEYARLTTQSDEMLAYMDGRMALAEGKNDLAARKMDEYQAASGGSDFRAYLYTAQALLRLGQKGAAYDALTRANTLAGGRSAPVLIQLASLDLEGGKIDDASRNVEQALVISPDSPQARSLKDRIDLARGADPTFGAEPELAAIIAAQRAAQEARDVSAARQPLLDALEQSPQNVRLLRELAALEASLGNSEEARSYVDRGLAVEPTNESLRIMKARIDGSDLRSLLIQIVDERAALSPMDRLLAKWRELTRFGFDQEADTYYRQALAQDPDHPELIESEFVAALETSDLDRASDLAARAAQLDVDQAQGLTYAGRLALARKDAERARTIFDQATRLKSYDGSVWRFLAVAQREAGLLSDSLESFRQSLARRPDDVATLREYAALQLLTNDQRGALATIRQAQAYEPGDAAVLKLYLDLEGRYGDRDRIIARRRSMYKTNPADIENAVALVDLLVLNGDRDAAAEIIEAIDPRRPVDRLRVADVKARWHAGAGDLVAARAAYESYLLNVNEPAELVEGYLGYARFLASVNAVEESIAAARKATQWQDSRRREADRYLGEYLVDQGRLADALPHYEMARQADPESGALALREAEIRINLAASDEDAGEVDQARVHRDAASAIIRQYVGQNGPNVETSLLEARLLADAGDEQAASEAVNAAVAAYPTDKRVYLVRAQFTLRRIRETGNTALADQLVRDVNRASELDTRDATALRLLAQFYTGIVRPDGSRIPGDLVRLKDTLSRAVGIEPRNDALRFQLIDVCALQNDLNTALAVVQQGADAAPRNPLWREIAGDLKQRRGDAPSAYLSEYQRAFDLEPVSTRLTKWVKSILDSPAPSTQPQAVARFNADNGRQVLGILDSNAEIAGPDLYLATIRARATAYAQGREAGLAVLRPLRDLIMNAPNQPDLRALTGWYEALSVMVPAADAVTYVDSLSGQGATPADHLLLAQLLVGPVEDSGKAESNSLLAIEHLVVAQEMLAEDSSSAWPLSLRVSCSRLLGDTYMRLERHEEAVAAWGRALALNPDDVASNNNIAFVLAGDLDRPGDALPYAQRAYGLAPQSPEIADTYGYVLGRAGRPADAERVLRAALSVRPLPALHIHLGEVLVLQSRSAEARAQFEAGKALAQRMGLPMWVQQADEHMNRMTDAGTDG